MPDDQSHTPEPSQGSAPDLLDRERWKIETAFRERELSVREAEVSLKKKEASLGWRSPIILAIVGATLTAIVNFVVAYRSGVEQRDLEDRKAEHARILEMIKTGDPDKAAVNLKFLLEAGLIGDHDQANKIQRFLDHRKPGSGPSLPSATPVTTTTSLPARVYFEVANPSVQQKDAEALAKALTNQLSDMPLRAVIQSAKLGSAPKTTELRFFRDVDELEAREIAAAVEANGLEVSKPINAKQFAGADRPRHYELWWAPGAALRSSINH